MCNFFIAGCPLWRLQTHSEMVQGLGMAGTWQVNSAKLCALWGVSPIALAKLCKALSIAHFQQHYPAALRWGQLISPQYQCEQGREILFSWMEKLIRACALHQRYNFLCESWALIIEHGHLAVGETGPRLPLNVMAFGRMIPLAGLKTWIPVKKSIGRVVMGWHDLGLGVGQEIIPERQPEREEKTNP